MSNNCSGTKPCTPDSDDGQIKIYRDSLRIYQGNNMVSQISLCDFLINYKNYCYNKINLNKGDEILIDNCNLGFKANLLFIKITEIQAENTRPFYLDKLKLNLTTANKINVVWRNTECIEWQPIYNLLLLTGTDSNPVKPIIIKNNSSVNINLDILVSNPSNETNIPNDACVVDSDVIMIDDLYYNNIISYNPHTIQITKNEEVKISIVIDNISFYKRDDKLITIDMSNSKKIYLLFVSLTETNQIWSSLNYLIANKENHLSSTSKSFSLPLTYDNEPPIITYNQKNIYTDTNNNLNTKLFLDSFERLNGNKVITKENLNDFLIINYEDNRDGKINKSNELLKIFKENQEEIDKITEKGEFKLKIKIKDLAENTKETEIKMIIV